MLLLNPESTCAVDFFSTALRAAATKLLNITLVQNSPIILLILTTRSTVLSRLVESEQARNIAFLESFLAMLLYHTWHELGY
jgi:hypothetical protein